MALTRRELAVGALLLVGLGTVLVVKLQFQAPERAEQAFVPEPENPGLSNSLPQTAEQMPLPTGPSTVARSPNPRLPAPRMLPKPDEPEIAALATRLVHGEEFKLKRGQVEDYLEKNGRSGQNLIAGFIATYDAALLQEALETSPTDPLINLVNYCSALLGEGSPEERRQRLDGFKQAAPDNPLGSYLSAYEYFHAGQADQAVQELQDAYGKGSIEDYRPGLFGDLEKMYSQAGYSANDASSIAAATPVPFLSLLKLEGPQISELAGLYRQGGDELSAQASMQIGLDLGERLAQLSDYPMANLTGVRLQKQLLQGLDPSSAYGPNGLTVNDQLALLSQREQSLVELGQQTLSPEDRANGRLWFPPKTLAQGPK
jgi:hypothetical protein